MTIRNLLLLAISLGFVALGGFLIAASDAPEAARIGWICILFFGGGAAVGAIDLIESVRPPRPLLDQSALRMTTNRIRAAIIGLAAGMWLAVGVIGMSAANLPALMAWLIAIFGALMALIGFGLAWNGRTKVVVDREGIADYRQLTVKALWENVYAVGIAHDVGPAYVFVWLRQPDEYREKQTWLARLLKRPIDPLQILDVELAGTVDDIMDAVRQFAPHRVWRERLIDPHGPRL